METNPPRPSDAATQAEFDEWAAASRSSVTGRLRKLIDDLDDVLDGDDNEEHAALVVALVAITAELEGVGTDPCAACGAIGVEVLHVHLPACPRWGRP